MDTTEILVIGKHPQIMQTILHLINNKPEWNGTGAFTYDEAIALFKREVFRVVLIGAGLSAQENDDLCNFFSAHKPDVPVIQHYGGGSGLLFGEIYEAL